MTAGPMRIVPCSCCDDDTYARIPNGDSGVVWHEGRLYCSESCSEAREHPDWCKQGNNITGDWYTPNGNTYCSECDHDK